MKKSTSILPLLAIIFQLSCTMTKYELPSNKIDHPVILPDGMSRHDFNYNASAGDNDDSERIQDSVLSGVIPAYGLSQSWEMPFVLLPYFRVLLGENDYYTKGRLSQDRAYHVVSFGITSFGIRDRGDDEESFADYGGGYEYYGFLTEDLRLDISLDGLGRSNNDLLLVGFHPKLRYRLAESDMATLGFMLSGGRIRDWFRDLYFDEYTGIRNANLYLSVDRFFAQNLSVGLAAGGRSYLTNEQSLNQVSWNYETSAYLNLTASLYW